MDYINGSELDLRALSKEQQERIFEGHITQMHALKPTHLGREETADGSGIFDKQQPRSPIPPFKSIEEFHYPKDVLTLGPNSRL